MWVACSASYIREDSLKQVTAILPLTKQGGVSTYGRTAPTYYCMYIHTLPGIRREGQKTTTQQRCPRGRRKQPVQSQQSWCMLLGINSLDTPWAESCNRTYIVQVLQLLFFSSLLYQGGREISPEIGDHTQPVSNLFLFLPFGKKKLFCHAGLRPVMIEEERRENNNIPGRQSLWKLRARLALLTARQGPPAGSPRPPRPPGPTLATQPPSAGRVQVPGNCCT